MRIPFKNSEEEEKIGKIYNGNKIIAIPTTVRWVEGGHGQCQWLRSRRR